MVKALPSPWSHAPRQDDRLLRVLHDAVLQRLEFIASDGFGKGLRRGQSSRLARDAADVIRAEIEGGGAEMLEDSGLSMYDTVHEIVRLAQEMAPCCIQANVSRRCSRLSGPACAAVARATREALANASRHGRPTRIVVSGYATESSCVVAVDDDGDGFDVDLVRATGGIHRSIVDPIEQVGGYVHIRSQAGIGSHLTIAVPLTQGGR